jgi:hypothetical protein
MKLLASDAFGVDEVMASERAMVSSQILRRAAMSIILMFVEG